jgi:CRP-like cAMP-binding protein
MARRFVDVTERAIYLRSIPVAAELPPRVLHLIAHSLVERELPEGTALLRAGEPVDGLHLLTEGELSLVRGGVEVGRLKPPQSVGFLDILARAEGSYDAIATSPTKSLELRADRLFEIMEDHFALLRATLRYAAERLLYEMQELPEKALSLPPEVMPITVPDRPMDLVERVLVMRSMNVFRRTNVNALTVLTEHMPEMRVPAGTVLFDIGEAPTFSVFIVDGAVCCTAADGRTFTHGPGTASGGVESLAEKPRWYRAVAETDLVYLRGSGDSLLDMMEDNFDLGLDFVSMLTNGLRAMIARKAQAGAASLEKKRDVSGLGAVPVGA